MRTLPMFPLGTVLLPYRILPLHLFERRYRALIRDVLAGTAEFGVVLIERGHEVGGGEQRLGTGCLARVLASEELEDGRWLVTAVGTRRLRVASWLPDDPYPRALVEQLDDQPDETTLADVQTRIEPRLRHVLQLEARLAGAEPAPGPDLVDDAVVACWQAAVLAPLSPIDAQRLLETDACGQRLRLLEAYLSAAEEILRFRLNGR